MEKTPEEIMAEKVKGLIIESEGKITESVNLLLKEMADGNEAKLKELEEIAEKQGNEITDLKNNSTKEVEKSIREQVREGLKSALDGKSIEQCKAAAKAGSISFKVASTYMVSTNVTGDVVRRVIDPVWDAAPTVPVFLPMLAPEVPISAPRETVVELYNRDGDAAFTAEGVTAPLIDFENKTTDFDAKTVDAMVRVSEKSLNDIDLLEDAITNELMTKIALKQQQKVFAGGGGDEPVGINTTASAFAITSIETTDPNIEDCIIAAATQIQTLNHMADFVLMNVIDSTNMKLEKDDVGRPIIPRDRPGIGGLKVFTTADATVMPVGYILVGDSSKIRHRLYRPLEITMGYDLTGDFGKGIVSIKGLKEIIAYIPTQNQNAFVYDSIATITGAITAVAA